MSGQTAGRPSIYTPEVAAALCERLADGQSLRSICDSDDMPAKSTVFRWLAEQDEQGNWANSSFRDQYAHARETQAETLFDDILTIADDGRNDWMERKTPEGKSLGWVENGEALRRSLLRVDARKWMASKILPKKYGERVTNVLEGGDKPLQVNAPKSREVAKALALILAKGLQEKQ